jgi:tetratricopeptide (TPR) repeat protein
MNNDRTNNTIVTTDDPRRLSPIEAAIMDWCNLAHAARTRGDHAELVEIGKELNTLIRKYDESDGDGHANPAWARPNQRALTLSARDMIEEAVEVEMVAAKYADTDRRKEVSYGNIADRLVRLERPEEAIEWFLKAWDAAPLSVPVMMTGARAFFDAGHNAEANDVFAALGNLEDLLEPGTDLYAYLRFDDSLLDMAPHLTALDDLYRKLASTMHDAEGE